MKTVGAITLLIISASVNAQTRYNLVWTCTLNEGHAFEELNAIHGKWLKWASKQSYGGDISGYVAQAVVADDFSLLVVDSYPDMKTYAADIAAFADSKEGQALNAEYEKVSTCTSNALYAVTDSGAK